jgi:hypothetical protein
LTQTPILSAQGKATSTSQALMKAAKRTIKKASSTQKHNCWLDLVSATRAKMVTFNEDVAQGWARSFVQSATRANR